MASAKSKKRDKGGNARAIPSQEALEERGWEEVGNEEIEKWEPGLKIIGRFVKLRDGQFGKLLVMETDDGMVVYGVKTILERKLDGVEPGDMLYVECLGEVTTSTGRRAIDFKVLRKRSGAVQDRKQETLPI